MLSAVVAFISIKLARQCLFACVKFCIRSFRPKSSPISGWLFALQIWFIVSVGCLLQMIADMAMVFMRAFCTA